MDLLITQSMIKHKNNPSNPSSSSYFTDRSVKKRNSLVQKPGGLLTASNAPGGGGGGRSGSNNMEIEDDESSSISYMMDEGADHTAAAANHKRKEFMIQELIKTANLRLNLFVNNENIKKKEPVLVEVFLIFLRVGEIDNVKERFQADAYFEASWEDDAVVNAESGVFDPHLNWEPELFIENAVGNLKQDIKYRIEKSKDSNMVRVHEMRNIRGIFWERLELWDFPLDVQSLSITITSSRNKNEVLFAPSRYNECTINTNDFQQQQEWNLYSHVEVSKKYIYDAWNKHERPCFTISSTISRRPGYYLYNAYMLIFLISILGFVPFSISCKLPHFRIQTTCLLILSSINFRWIVTQKLPTVSYLTTLDKYAIGALIFLVLLCVWHAFIGSEMFLGFTLDTIITIDQFALVLISIMYIVFHVVYVTHFILRYKRYKKIGPNTNLIGSTSSVEAPFTEFSRQISGEQKSEIKASESSSDRNDSKRAIASEATGAKIKAESKMC